MIRLALLATRNNQPISSLLTASRQLNNQLPLPSKPLRLLQLRDLCNRNLKQHRPLLPTLDSQIIQPRRLISGEVENRRLLGRINNRCASLPLEFRVKLQRTEGLGYKASFLEHAEEVFCMRGAGNGHCAIHGDVAADGGCDSAADEFEEFEDPAAFGFGWWGGFSE